MLHAGSPAGCRLLAHNLNTSTLSKRSALARAHTRLPAQRKTAHAGTPDQRIWEAAGRLVVQIACILGHQVLNKARHIWQRWSLQLQSRGKTDDDCLLPHKNAVKTQQHRLHPGRHGPCICLSCWRQSLPQETFKQDNACGSDLACQGFGASRGHAHLHFDVQRGEACEVVQGHLKIVVVVIADWVQIVDLQSLKAAQAPQAPQTRPVQAPAATKLRLRVRGQQQLPRGKALRWPGVIARAGMCLQGVFVCAMPSRGRAAATGAWTARCTSDVPCLRSCAIAAHPELVSMCNALMLAAAGALAMPPSAMHSGCCASTGLSSPRNKGSAARQSKLLWTVLQDS